MLTYIKKINFCCFFLSILLCICTSFLSAQTTTLPYYCGFEDATENATWVLNNKPSVLPDELQNKWVIANGAKQSGYRGLYIYTDNDSTRSAYVGTSTMRTIAYREFNLPQGTYDLVFSWLSNGDGNNDALYVYWMPASTSFLSSPSQNALTPTARLQTNLITGTNYLSGTNSWQRAKYTLTVPANPGAYKLAFMWRNNADATVASPGACVDNIQIQVAAPDGDCKEMPTNVQYTETSTMLTLNWNGNTANYEILYFLQGSGKVDTIQVRGNSHAFQKANMPSGLYTFWVRSVCDDGTSLWAEVSGVNIRGQFVEMATACPEITFMETIENATGTGIKYLIPDCRNDVFTIKPSITAGGGSIAGYRCDAINYDPPFSFDKGVDVDADFDDAWTKKVKMPFRFCFFDGIYDEVVVGANGILSFNANLAGEEIEWQTNTITDNIPSPNIPAEFRNAIYGVWEDMDPRDCDRDEGAGLRYGVLGEWPCRTFTVSWDRVPLYEGSAPNSYQMVLYEGTNVVDVYVKERNSNNWNENGCKIAIGLQNQAGTDGVTAPGRNLQDPLWTVESSKPEAWRFTPYSTPVYDLTWYKGIDFNQVIGYGDSINLQRPEDKTIETDTIAVRLQFTALNGDYFQLDDTVIVYWGTLDTLRIDTVLCANTPFLTPLTTTGIHELDSAGYYEYMLPNQLGCDSAVYELTLNYYPYNPMIKYDTICLGESYYYTHQGKDILLTTVVGENYYGFEHVFDDGYICYDDSLYLYVIDKLEQNDILINEYSYVCAIPDSQTIYMSFTCNPNKVNQLTTYDVLFGEREKSVGFTDMLNVPVEELLYVNIPPAVVPDDYEFIIRFADLGCGALDVLVPMQVLYQWESVATQKWDDVLAVYNQNYNTGNYQFASFQWYLNGSPIIGQTNAYFYNASGPFQAGDTYQVGLVRIGENKEIRTCPYTIVETTTRLTKEQYVEQVEIWGLLGDRVLTIKCDGSLPNTYPTLAKGTYILNIKYKDGSQRSQTYLVK